jgi:beta-glucanase (GH16 family)|tara:strand:+ start:1582 stop:2451 length:870 start_codon:yes stop_codon:yes gene_type:complete
MIAIWIMVQKLINQFIIFTLLFTVGCNSQSNSDVPIEKDPWLKEGWDIFWHDEFDGVSLDMNKWSHEIGGHGFGNNELQYYTDNTSNSFVNDGMLHIRAKFEPAGIGSSNNLRNYSSARLRTVGKGDWQYVRIDVRAKIALGQGIWPAIWMLPSDWIYGGWPKSGEIDIMEHVGKDEGRIHGSVHTESYNHMIGTQRTNTKLIADVKNLFHIYSIEWYEDKIDFFIDDSLHFTFKNDNKSDYKTWPFNERFHLLLNVAVGGNWPGPPDNTTVFPQDMQVDYVRVYKKQK